MSRGRTDQPALYEPIHGSAPTLAGKDVACPLGAILSASMMLKESFGLETESQWIEAAVDRALERGYRTADIAEPGGRVVRGSELTAQIRSELQEVLVHHERYGWGVALSQCCNVTKASWMRSSREACSRFRQQRPAK